MFSIFKKAPVNANEIAFTSLKLKYQNEQWESIHVGDQARFYPAKYSSVPTININIKGIDGFVGRVPASLIEKISDNLESGKICQSIVSKKNKDTLNITCKLVN